MFRPCGGDASDKQTPLLCFVLWLGPALAEPLRLPPTDFSARCVSGASRRVLRHCTRPEFGGIQPSSHRFAAPFPPITAALARLLTWRHPPSLERSCPRRNNFRAGALRLAADEHDAARHACTPGGNTRHPTRVATRGSNRPPPPYVASCRFISPRSGAIRRLARSRRTYAGASRRCLAVSVAPSPDSAT